MVIHVLLARYVSARSRKLRFVMTCRNFFDHHQVWANRVWPGTSLHVVLSLKFPCLLPLAGCHGVRHVLCVATQRTHTYMHTYIHTYLHTYIHTSIHADTHTRIHAYMHTHTHIQTYKQLSHTQVSHTYLSPVRVSFLPFPFRLHLSFLTYWKKLTCGFVRSFNFPLLMVIILNVVIAKIVVVNPMGISENCSDLAWFMAIEMKGGKWWASCGFGACSIMFHGSFVGIKATRMKWDKAKVGCAGKWVEFMAVLMIINHGKNMEIRRCRRFFATDPSIFWNYNWYIRQPKSGMNRIA